MNERNIVTKQRKEEFDKNENKMEAELSEDVKRKLLADKDNFRGYFTTQDEYESSEFFGALVYCLLYYFAFGYFTNILLWLFFTEDD